MALLHLQLRAARITPRPKIVNLLHIPALNPSHTSPEPTLCHLNPTSYHPQRYHTATGELASSSPQAASYQPEPTINVSYTYLLPALNLPYAKAKPTLLRSGCTGRSSRQTCSMVELSITLQLQSHHILSKLKGLSCPARPIKNKDRSGPASARVCVGLEPTVESTSPLA